jgi:hypothetical protein
MVVVLLVDTSHVVHRVLVTVAWVCCGLVIASFALFVHDQLKQGSAHQVQLLSGTGPLTPATPAPRQPAQPRRFIDGARHDLTSPFDSLVSSDSKWVNEGVPDLLALLVYGGGIGFAARYTRGRSHSF